MHCQEIEFDSLALTIKLNFIDINYSGILCNVIGKVSCS